MVQQIICAQVRPPLYLAHESQYQILAASGLPCFWPACSSRATRCQIRQYEAMDNGEIIEARPRAVLRAGLQCMQLTGQIFLRS